MKSFTNQISRLSLVAVALFTLLSSCAKEQVQPDAVNHLQYPESSLLSESSPWQQRFVEITYQYDYKGEAFTVVHKVDQETSEILESHGDVEKEDRLIGSANSGKTMFYDVTTIAEDAHIKAFIFDSEAGAAAFAGVAEEASKSCNYYESPGNGYYQFFEHAGYSGIMGDLTKVQKSVLNWNYVMNHNNDKISSFYLNESGGQPHTSTGLFNGFIQIYHDWCFGGSTTYFGSFTDVLQVPDLSVIGPRYHRGFHNDEISSLKAYWRY